MSQPVPFSKEPNHFPHELLRLYRTRAGLSQEELAKAIGLTGSRMVQSWEGGFALPKPARLRKIIEVFRQRQGFTPGRESGEAHQLWLSVKALFDGTSDRFSTYPFFDEIWFENISRVEPTAPEPAPPTIIPHSIPLPSNRFYGRERELEEVTKILLEQQIPLLTLTGVGGSGKTRLALEIAARLLPLFPDGVYFVSLETVTSQAMMVSQLASELGISHEDTRPDLQVLKEYLGPRKMLLVLDNFEQLCQAAPVIEELVAAAPATRFFLTSREALAVRCEKEYQLLPLAMPVLKDSPETLSQNPAIALFADRAKMASPDFSLTGENVQEIAQICQKLDGLPLALELAAGRTSLLTPAQILTRLDKRFRLLASKSSLYSNRQRTMYSALEWSYELLEPAEQSLFGRLAVFAGSFTVEGVEKVCGLEFYDALDGLDSLVKKNLLQRLTSSGGEIRCHLLQLIREFALEKLSASGEVESVETAYLAYYLELVENSEAKLHGKEEKLVLERLDTEYPNLRDVLQKALARQDAITANRLSGALWYYWWVRGYVSEGRSFLEQAVALSGGDGTGRALALNALGNLVDIQGEIELAARYFSESLEVYRLAGDKKGMASALNNLGNVVSVQGNYAQARLYLEQSLELRRELKAWSLIAGSLNNLGRLCRIMGDQEESLRYYRQALELYRQQGDPGGIAQVLSNLANLALNLGDSQAAKNYALESLKLTEETKNLGMKISVSQALARAFFSEGDYPKAILYLREALELSRNMGDSIQTAVTLDLLGRVLVETAEYTEAQRCLEESFVYFEAVGSKQGRIGGYLSQAALAARTGAPARALDLLAQVEKLQQEWQTPLEPLEVLYYRQVLKESRDTAG